jgi:hypothetical protein
VSATVGLALGNFAIRHSDSGEFSTFRGTLMGDWDVIELGTTQKIDTKTENVGLMDFTALVRIGHAVDTSALFPSQSRAVVSAAFKKVSAVVGQPGERTNDQLLKVIIDLEGALGEGFNPSIQVFLNLFEPSGEPKRALDSVLKNAGLPSLDWSTQGAKPCLQTRLTFGSTFASLEQMAQFLFKFPICSVVLPDGTGGYEFCPQYPTDLALCRPHSEDRAKLTEGDGKGPKIVSLEDFGKTKIPTEVAFALVRPSFEAGLFQRVLDGFLFMPTSTAVSGKRNIDTKTENVSLVPQWTANRLRTSLVEAGITVDESFVMRVIGSRALQNSLAFCSSAADVAAFHEMAMRDPQSETRAIVLSETGISIDGDIFFPHHTTALFKWAFDGPSPCVLKIPQNSGAAERECRLYNAVGAAARDAGLNLVPVRFLRLRGSHNVRKDVTILREGILMPPYPVTLSDTPQPVIRNHGFHLFSKLERIISFLGERKWVHGDVKPSNIFLDNIGEPWLGDFGSSFELQDVESTFSGGTPSFQIEGVEADAPDAAFDRASLVISFVTALGLLEACSRDALQWSVISINKAIEGVVDIPLLHNALMISLNRALKAAGIDLL